MLNNVHNLIQSYILVIQNIDSAVNGWFMSANNTMDDYVFTLRSTVSVMFTSYCMKDYDFQLF